MKVSSPAWRVATAAGPAASLHERSASLVAGPHAPLRSVQLLEATDRCVVLGSTQPLGAVDASRLADAGMTVTRRRSGGGAVLVGPGEVLWADVVVPVGDALWTADVSRAGWWLGAVWSRALETAGLGPVETWQGPLVRTAWSDRVCFAGLGPGEVTVDGRKALGISQRRTRTGTLFQCALPVRWVPSDLVEVLDLPDADRDRAASDLAGSALGVGVEVADAVLRGFLAALGADHADRR